MRLRIYALLACSALALTGCNETLDAIEKDVSHVKNKVEHPVSPELVAQMKKLDMERTAPIMIRVFKEEGTLEIWKAKRNNRFDRIAEYSICAWSGKLGPKIKEGDRQAPEGFYNLSPAHLNPNSQYYLAINTGFPNHYDAANARTGSNLMIHGACSSSGCYSMTDGQMLEIFALARDAFKGGQKSVQFQAFPFKMTPENMARHSKSEHFEFWKMLKEGYDHFEITKRPPDVNVCEKRYVFNQQSSGAFKAANACPAMSTPPAMASALLSYDKKYDLAYEAAIKKLRGKVWYDPSEAERKALVVDKRKGRPPEYAPTGSSLKAGRLMGETEYAAMIQKRSGNLQAPMSMPASGTLTAQAATGASAIAEASTPRPAGTARQTAQSTMVASAPAIPTAGDATETANVPIPQMNPLAFNDAPPATEEAKKPFWKFWAKQ
jgi:murein L,D-transpeptidase YafK